MLPSLPIFPLPITLTAICKLIVIVLLSTECGGGGTVCRRSREASGRASWSVMYEARSVSWKPKTLRKAKAGTTVESHR